MSSSIGVNLPLNVTSFSVFSGVNVKQESFLPLAQLSLSQLCWKSIAI